MKKSTFGRSIKFQRLTRLAKKKTQEQSTKLTGDKVGFTSRRSLSSSAPLTTIS
jgi:hypothetical protein